MSVGRGPGPADRALRVTHRRTPNALHGVKAGMDGGIVPAMPSDARVASSAASEPRQRACGAALTIATTASLRTPRAAGKRSLGPAVRAHGRRPRATAHRAAVPRRAATKLTCGARLARLDAAHSHGGEHRPVPQPLGELRRLAQQHAGELVANLVGRGAALGQHARGGTVELRGGRGEQDVLCLRAPAPERLRDRPSELEQPFGLRRDTQRSRRPRRSIPSRSRTRSRTASAVAPSSASACAASSSGWASRPSTRCSGAMK